MTRCVLDDPLESLGHVDTRSVEKEWRARGVGIMYEMGVSILEAPIPHVVLGLETHPAEGDVSEPLER